SHGDLSDLHSFPTHALPISVACLLRREAQALFGGPTTTDLVLHWLVQSRGLAKLGRWDEAQAAFTKVIELRPAQGRFRLDRAHRSEEHTSELQSRGHLVCRR